jgi:hypothetical protein
MRRVLGGLTVVAAMGFLLAGVPPSASAVTNTNCDDLGNAGVPIPPHGAVTGNLTVPAGVSCTLNNVRVTGSVTQLGQSLLLVKNASRIGGGITSTNASELLLQDTTIVGGNVIVRNIGTNPPNPGGTQICGTIGGNLTITGTPDNTTFKRYWVIGDDVSDVNGTYPNPCPEGAKVRIGGTFNYNNNHTGADVFHLRVGHEMNCSGNTTPFGGAPPVWLLDNSTGSTAGPNHDGMLGQCAVQ